MKSAIVALVVATAVGGAVANAQEKLQPQSGKMPQVAGKELPLASAKGSAAEAAGTTGNSMSGKIGDAGRKVGDAGLVSASATSTDSKPKTP
jgi:hypothetical protein